MLLKRLFMAVPLTIGWLIYTSQLTPGNVVVGYVFSFAVLVAFGFKGETFKLQNIPRQLVNIVIYVLFLSYEVLMSGLTVARIALSPSLPINPALAKINTQDETENPVISAISAHGITITPGELVVDFEETGDDGVLMIIHSLEMDKSAPNLNTDQTKRLKRIKGMLGYD